MKLFDVIWDPVMRRRVNQVCSRFFQIQSPRHVFEHFMAIFLLGIVLKDSFEPDTVMMFIK